MSSRTNGSQSFNAAIWSTGEWRLNRDTSEKMIRQTCQSCKHWKSVPVLFIAIHAACLREGDRKVTDVRLVEVLATSRVTDVPIPGEDPDGIGLFTLHVYFAIAAARGLHGYDALVWDIGVLVRGSCC